MLQCRNYMCQLVFKMSNEKALALESDIRKFCPSTLKSNITSQLWATVIATNSCDSFLDILTSAVSICYKSDVIKHKGSLLLFLQLSSCIVSQTGFLYIISRASNLEIAGWLENRQCWIKRVSPARAICSQPWQLCVQVILCIIQVQIDCLI